MQINVRSRFDLTSQTRSIVESRLVSALGPFTFRIESVAVHLEAGRSRTQPDAASCSIVVSLRPAERGFDGHDNTEEQVVAATILGSEHSSRGPALTMEDTA